MTRAKAAKGGDLSPGPEPGPEPAAVPRWHLHRRLYNWVLHWADTRYGVPALVIISFTESSFFPIPPDVLLIALVLGATTRWWRFACWCLLASVAGGVLGYGIGLFAWEQVGRWIIEQVVHIELVQVDGRDDLRLPGYLIRTMGPWLGGEYLFQVYDRFNAWIVFIFGLTPLPYKLVTITAGVARVNFPIFLAASICARAARFFLVAWVLHRWGHTAKRFIDRYFNLLCVLFVILLVGGFAVLKLAV